MKTLSRLFILFSGIMLFGVSLAQTARTPHIGYVYPAGIQGGTTQEVIIGGQNLRGVKEAFVSGGGIEIEVKEHMRALTKQQEGELRRKIRELRQAKLPPRVRERIKKAAAERAAKNQNGGGGAELRKKNEAAKEKAGNKKGNPYIKIPDHPMLRGLEDKSLAELDHIAFVYLENKKKQPNKQLGEMVLLSVRAAETAEAGNHELRVQTPWGMSNPIVFQVGNYPEGREFERRGAEVDELLVKPPMTVNGQIMPGDIDRFKIFAQKGEHVTLRVWARELVPYLADAVPGWFQPVIVVYDENGKEIVYADDYYFQPDPIVSCDIPQTGIYEIEVRDAIYRGREDFVYRLAVANDDSLFPRCPANALPKDAEAGIYRENEKNDSIKMSEEIMLPRMIAGKISEPKDEDVFLFSGKAGDVIVGEIYGRRLDSPIDSVIRIYDAKGNIIALNDDFSRLSVGLLVQHTDSRVELTLPKDGVYYAKVSDAAGHGGDAFGYHFYLGAPRPDFEVFLNPSALSVAPGSSSEFTVHACRRDGFAGEIRLQLEDAPKNLILQGGVIPVGCDKIRMTLAYRGKPFQEPFPIRITASAAIAGETVTHEAVPAEDMMQAFLNRHIVPAESLMVASSRFQVRLPVIDTPYEVMRLAKGAEKNIYFPLRWNAPDVSLEFALAEPPKGITLSGYEVKPREIKLSFTTDGESMAEGFSDNLIVNVIVVQEYKDKNDPTKTRTRKVNSGVLPAIPVQIVAAR